LNIPESPHTCQLSIINTTCDITIPPAWLVEPPIEGYKWMNLPTYSFHLKHASSGAELLFDLGGRKDWGNFVPKLSKLIRERMHGLRIVKDITDILPEGNVDISNIQAAIISHHHWDHVGAPAHLPKSVRLVVGPGFREAFLPGYPTNADSEFHEADFEGREVVEVPFSDDGLKIGQFRAHDYFGDGSFYILDVPGHAIGHVSGLVRTTPDTFVFLGGDVCHHCGVIRPSKLVPLPDEIPEEAVLDQRIPRPCPCMAFLSSHPDKENGHTVSSDPSAL
jgi:glyoxylase-like metal-dependent hydrolase (beta-lactamase superfamily II)